ncbi:tripartite motif-containing protein 59-like [Pecten maximus]|uniref:tripartite motif-containing protein 59-like n=1 Tax=Pecten maximus TaxID=6579 RepID=UPI00145864B5|nr:tripartite motif-containing protein 59-like [Pecten maximus]XP_033762414.1 tripartite motif-containing protein 59-like [Pecten maximus]XP_033762415.1 tripartite motif-containing protein 59-like [Pecten maximus]
MEMPSSDLRDIVSCPICYEDFDEPKSLPCLHTFCKECLQQLITKTMEPDVKKYFFCPSCRMKVYGPKGVPLEQWADTYPSNHMIRTLQDNIKMEDSDSICSVHKGKELEFFCTDHERTICSMCAVIEHRQCKDVNTVDSAAAKTKEKNFELDGKLHMLNKWMDKRKSQRQQIQTQLRDVETSVRAWRKKINDELDQWEYNLTEHVQTIAATEISQLEQDIRQGEQIMHNLKNVQTDIFGVDLSSRGILESRSSIATVLHAATDVVKSAGSGNTHLLFRFHPDESIKQSLSRIGDIEVVRQGKDTSLNSSKQLHREGCSIRKSESASR